MIKMNEMISEYYNAVERAANSYAYKNTNSMLFDLYKTAGLEGLIKAAETFDETKGASFGTHAYRCIHCAMENEKARIIRHQLPEQDDYDFAKYDCEVIELGDTEVANTIHRLIRKAVNGNERNARIVELHIGIDCEKVELKDIAEDFGLSHESVRLICKKAMAALRTDPQVKVTLYGKVG